MSDIVKLNNREYNIDCAFFNGVNISRAGKSGSTPISIFPYGMFNSLEVKDTLFNPFLTATAVIKNTRNLFEKSITGLEIENSFRFSASNRNILSVQISPTDIDNMSLNFTGVIENSCVYSATYDGASVLLVNLIDTKEAALKEQKIGCSNFKVTKDKPVGENIKNILKLIHAENSDSLFKDFFNTGDVFLDYNFPLHFTLHDALRFLTPFNMGTFNDLPTQLILRYEDKGLNPEYSNYSIFKLFKEAKESTANIETFALGNQSTDTNDPSKNISNNSFVPPHNILNNIMFSNVNFNVSNRDMVSIYVNNTSNSDSLKSMHRVDVIDTVKKFEDKILNTEQMKSIYNKVVANVDVETDPGKRNDYNYKLLSTQFSTDISKKLAEVQLYNSFIFENMSISFQAPGQVYRTPGKFINIVKQSDFGGSFDEKIIGQWLVTEVIHKFTNGIYTNVIQCVKPFRIET